MSLSELKDIIDFLIPRLESSIAKSSRTVFNNYYFLKILIGKRKVISSYSIIFLLFSV